MFVFHGYWIPVWWGVRSDMRVKHLGHSFEGYCTRMHVQAPPGTGNPILKGTSWETKRWKCVLIGEMSEGIECWYHGDFKYSSDVTPGDGWIRPPTYVQTPFEIEH